MAAGSKTEHAECFILIRALPQTVGPVRGRDRRLLIVTSPIMNAMDTLAAQPTINLGIKSRV
jgi:hypothetical protein